MSISPWRFRLFLTVLLEIISGMLFVATLVSKQWIETIFRIDPDHGNGWTELLLIAAFLIVTLALGIIARYEWRRSRVNPA